MSSFARQILLAALLLGAVVGLFVAAAVGQRRLEDASARVQLAAVRQGTLADVAQLLSEAESSQRGYILLDNPQYLQPFDAAAARAPQALGRLELAFAAAPAEVRSEIAEVRRLGEAKFAEMRQTLQLYRTRGQSAALELIRSDIGRLTMGQIEALIRQVQTRETRQFLEASRSWRLSRWVTFATTSTALAASIGLMILLMRQALRHVRARDREAAELARRQSDLERLVARRTEELSELSTHLQSIAEQEKSLLSRELHDELGGLLIAARMDVSWIEDRVGSGDAEVLEHFRRVHEALQAGVELKRRVVENLRPSLLDNLGLFAALRWQVADTCGRAGLRCLEHYPPEDLPLSPEAAITVFRIVQEALNNILKHARARSVDIVVQSQGEWLLVRIRDDGVGLPPARLRALGSHGLAAMRHRALVLGGQWQVGPRPGGGTQIEVRLPLAQILAAAPPAGASAAVQ
jgi:signal transduction histidine kinase